MIWGRDDTISVPLHCELELELRIGTANDGLPLLLLLLGYLSWTLLLRTVDRRAVQADEPGVQVYEYQIALLRCLLRFESCLPG